MHPRPPHCGLGEVRIEYFSAAQDLALGVARPAQGPPGAPELPTLQDGAVGPYAMCTVNAVLTPESKLAGKPQPQTHFDPQIAQS